MQNDQGTGRSTVSRVRAWSVVLVLLVLVTVALLDRQAVTLMVDPIKESYVSARQNHPPRARRPPQGRTEPTVEKASAPRGRFSGKAESLLLSGRTSPAACKWLPSSTRRLQRSPVAYGPSRFLLGRSDSLPSR
jgi:hypothetical protein